MSSYLGGKMNTVGNIIKTLRKELNYTQQGMGKLLKCSTRTYRRIENDEQFPTHLQIHQLNKVFKIDLNDYIIAINRFKNYDTYIICQELRQALLNQDRESTKIIYEKNKDNVYFQVGEPFDLMIYAKANILLNNDDSPTKCIDFLMKSFNYKSIDDVYESLKDNFHSPYFYSACICMEVAHYKLKNHDVSNKLAFLIYNNLNHYILDVSLFDGHISFSSQNNEYKRIFITATNNYADSLHDQGLYQESIDACKICISNCSKWKILKDLEYLNWLLFKSYYKLNKPELADKYLTHFKSICEMTGRTVFLEEKLKETETF